MRISNFQRRNTGHQDKWRRGKIMEAKCRQGEPYRPMVASALRNHRCACMAGQTAVSVPSMRKRIKYQVCRHFTQRAQTPLENIACLDAETLERLTVNQLFHSQCWKHIEAESRSTPAISYEVRVITANKLSSILEELGEPLSAFCLLRDDGESLVASVERWLCNRSSETLASWNRAMTGKK